MSEIKTTQENFHIIQDDLNALNVKGRLMTKWVNREILERIIPLYEKAIHHIIYPLIVE